MSELQATLATLLPPSFQGLVELVLSPAFLGFLVTLSVLSLLVTLVGLPWVLIRLPVDYFQQDGHDWGTLQHGPWPWWRVLFHLGKNLLGLVLLFAGLSMLVLPGQGLLTILAALFFLDFPGKRRLERHLISRPQILRQVNAIRRRAGRKPLRL